MVSASESADSAARARARRFLIDSSVLKNLDSRSLIVERAVSCSDSRAFIFEL